jgi:glutamate-1-semialdehyde 2,1-aminomutase
LSGSDPTEKYRENSPTSAQAFERARKVLPGGVKGAYYFDPYPLTVSHGDGCCLYDVDGRRYVDFNNHHTAQILGHNHPAVRKAIEEQVSRGVALSAPTGVETELAEEMCSRVSSLERVRFCNSGTEATLHAIRLARGFSKRTKIAKFEGGYHGSHDLVEVSVSPPLDQAGPENAPNSVSTAGGASPNAANEVVVLPYNDEDAVERLIAKHRNEVACVIFDPRAGILPLRASFVHFIRDLTRSSDMLLIFDEIVGFRAGPGGLQQQFGIEPDLTTYGKIIGGGFPVGAFGGRADLMDLFDTSGGPTGFFQSGTFSGHPVAMSAGLATLKQLTPEVFQKLDLLGDRLRTGIDRVFDEKGIKAQAVGTGSLFSIHFTDEEMTNYRSLVETDKGKAKELFLNLLNKGQYLTPGLIMCACSAAMEESHVDGLVDAVAECFTDSGT